MYNTQQQNQPEKPASKVTAEQLEKVSGIVEERRKERMKTLTRNLEVCDLLEIRNTQSVAEYAPSIYK